MSTVCVIVNEMRIKALRFPLVAMGLMITAATCAGSVSPAEMAWKEAWVAQHLEPPSPAPLHASRIVLDEERGGPPFSFVCGGQGASNLLASWPRQDGQRKLDEARTERSVVWTDPNSGLLVRCVGVDYSDFPTVEWTLYFKNPLHPVLKEVPLWQANHQDAWSFCAALPA